MIYRMWRLSENTPDNLGLAFTDDGLLLGRTPLIERRDGRFVVRDPSEIARLVMYSFPNGVAVERLMPGLAIVARALNANDQALARIAAVHLQIPDLPSLTKRNAMIAEDLLIKYARDGGVTAADWNPALHPRTGVPPNPGWFAPVDRGPHEARQEEAGGWSRLRLTENEDRSRRSDAALFAGDQKTLQAGNPFDEPANFTDRPGWDEFWSNIWPAVRDWLEEPVPEYDLESGQPVGERPRWRAIAPYLGIPAATAASFGVEAVAPTVAAWFGLHAPEATIIANALRGAASETRVLKDLGLVKNTRWVTTVVGRAIPDALTDAISVEIKDAAYVSATRQLWIQCKAAVASGRQSILVTGTKNEDQSHGFDVVQQDNSASRFGPAVKEKPMIHAALEFPSPAIDLVTKKILSLPKMLRPTAVRLAEDEPAVPIGGVDVFLQTFKMPSIGVSLQNPTVLYVVHRSSSNTWIVDADLPAIPDAMDFLIHMAIAHPIFGFACTEEELQYRNRITTKFGINTMESWVGRDTRRYIPGLYWWTLLPAALAEQHGISLSSLVQAANEHIELEGKQHLFRFYDKPGDWRSAAFMAELYRSNPGIFDVEKLRPKLEGAETFLEINAILDDWT